MSLGGLPRKKAPYRTGKVLGRLSPLPGKPRAVRSRAPQARKPR